MQLCWKRYGDSLLRPARAMTSDSAWTEARANMHCSERALRPPTSPLYDHYFPIFATVYNTVAYSFLVSLRSLSARVQARAAAGPAIIVVARTFPQLGAFLAVAATKRSVDA